MPRTSDEGGAVTLRRRGVATTFRSIQLHRSGSNTQFLKPTNGGKIQGREVTHSPTVHPIGARSLPLNRNDSVGMGSTPASGGVGRARAAHPGARKRLIIWCVPVRSGSARGRAELQPRRLCSLTKPTAAFRLNRARNDALPHPGLLPKEKVNPAPLL